MRKSSGFAAALVAVGLLIPARAAFAQEAAEGGSGPYVGLFGGFHGFARDGVFEVSGEEPGTPFIGGLRVGYDFAPHYGLEAEVGIIPAASAMVLPYRVNGLAYFPALAQVRPFILLGAGGLTGLSGADTTAAELHVGLGVLWNVTRNLGVRLEGRGLALLHNDQAQAPDWEALLGVAFRFGGAPAKAAKPAPAAEPAPARAPADGDGDGVPDDSDRCPGEAGPSENGGCPDTDGDGDGVVDRLDRCKDERGAPEDDGCPPKDSDSDGLLDREDRCPNEAETRNSYQDSDGCPDEVPQQLQKFTGSIAGIQFRTGSADLLSSSKTLLDGAAQMLEAHPEIRVNILGHTDNVGDAAKNQDLSQRRADAVKQYLVSKGVDEARLTARGYGMDRPVADNATAEGRQQNRRVEFQLDQ